MSIALNVPFPKFDQRITIVSYSETSDNYGGLAAPSETIVATEWAGFEHLSGGESYGASRITASSDYRITLWFNSNVTRKMVVKLGTRVFDILDIQNKGMHNEYMELYCTERL